MYKDEVITKFHSFWKKSSVNMEFNTHIKRLSVPWLQYLIRAACSVNFNPGPVPGEMQDAPEQDTDIASDVVNKDIFEISQSRWSGNHISRPHCNKTKQTL